MYSDIANKLIKLSEITNISINKLSGIAGIHAPNMYNFINQSRQTTISLKAIYKICKYFGFTIEYLIDTPIEEFTIENNKNKNIKDETLEEIYSMIADTYSKLNKDKKVWLKVEVEELIKEKIK